MSDQIPKYITERYELGARGFKQEKRQQVRRLQKALDELRGGCAFTPDECLAVEKIQQEINLLREELSVKKWGR